MARGEDKAVETTEIWGYLDELRRAGKFASEGQFAVAAGFLPSSFSDWKRGKHALSSYSLVRLIRAAAARRATAPFEAGEAVAPEVAILRRLAAVEEKADEALAGIGDVLDLLRRAPGESDEDAPGASQQ